MTYDLTAWNNSLAGDVAYGLFVSDKLSPLVDWVNENKADMHAEYLIAVIGSYRGMIERCADGRYKGKVRNI